MYEAYHNRETSLQATVSGCMHTDRKAEAEAEAEALYADGLDCVQASLVVLA